MGFIQASIEAESLIDAMNEDGGFAADVWLELAEKLHMGLLLDNACDLFSTDVKKAEYIANGFQHFAEMLRSRHDELTPRTQQ